jgi:hypothetical protein
MHHILVRYYCNKSSALKPTIAKGVEKFSKSKPSKQNREIVTKSSPKKIHKKPTENTQIYQFKARL